MITLALALLATPADAQELRALHLSPDAPAVDIFVDNATPPAVSDLAFTEGTGYLPVPSGSVNVKITATGTGMASAVLDVDLPTVQGVRLSAVAFDTLAGIQALALVDDDSGIAQGDVRLVVSHTAVGIGDVDVAVRGVGKVSAGLGFGESFEADLPAGAIEVGLDTDNDNKLDWTFDVPDLGSDALVNVFAATDANGQPFLLAWLPDGSTARVDGVPRADASVRVTHLSPDAPNVDVYVNGGLAVSDLAYEEVESGLTVPPGRNNVEVFVAGTTVNPVFDVTERFSSGGSYTVGAYGELASIELGVARAPSCDPGLLCARVVHAADGVGNVDIYEEAGGSLLLSDVPYGGAGALRVPTGPYIIGLDIDGDAMSDFTFDVPDVGAQVVDVIAVLDSVGPYLQVILEDGTPVRIDAN